MARLKAASFEDRLTLVEHLDELRNRIIFSLVGLGAAFAVCFWQNNFLLEVANRALPDGQQPVTLSPTEPFFTTVEVSGYGAAIIALPLILFQVYSFVLPAFSDRERKVIFPFVLAMPFLFLAGVAFAYFVVMPIAVEFLLNFNEEQFNIEVRAREYYGFFGLMLMAMGLLFQIPIVMLTLTRLEIVSADWFAHNRRYAIFIIAVVSAAAPGGDPVSMLLIMGPLLLLYESSILLARRFGHGKSEDDDDDDDGPGGGDTPKPKPPSPTTPASAPPAGGNDNGAGDEDDDDDGLEPYEDDDPDDEITLALPAPPR